MGNMLICTMKTWTLRFRVKDMKNFEEVRSGLKEYETRAASVKYQSIEKGDTLIFVCGKKRFSKKIVKKFHWSSIDAMIKEIPFKKIMPSVESLAEMKKAYASYSSYEGKIKRYGLLGLN